MASCLVVWLSRDMDIILKVLFYSIVTDWSGLPVWLIASNNLRYSARDKMLLYTWEKVKITQFFPSDMMHFHFAIHKVAK